MKYKRRYVFKAVYVEPDPESFGTIFKGTFSAKRKNAVLKYFAIMLNPGGDLMDFVDKLRKLADVLESYIKR